MTAPCLPELAGFRCIILDADQLRNHQCLEPLRTMVNRAFAEGTNIRFPTTESVYKTIGVHGRCSVLFREDDVKMINPVAAAMIKYHSPSVGVEAIGEVKDGKAVYRSFGDEDRQSTPGVLRKRGEFPRV